MTDYREILKRELRYRREKNPSYSQGAFARDLGIIPNRLAEILSGKQGLSPGRGADVAAKLGLTKEETETFVDLIRVKHSRSRIEREEAKSRLDSKMPAEYRQLDLAVFRVLSDWLPFAILEALRSSKPSVPSLAKRFLVEEKRVKEAVVNLQRVGLLSIEGKTWKPLASNTTTARGVPSLAIKQFHRRVIERADHALYRTPMEAREFSSLVLSVEKHRVPELKEKIRKFTREIDETFRTESAESDVACVSMQYFPLSIGND